MAKIKVDYTGKRFHYLTVVRFIPPEERDGYSHDKDTRKWLCRFLDFLKFLDRRTYLALK